MTLYQEYKSRATVFVIYYTSAVNHTVQKLPHYDVILTISSLPSTTPESEYQPDDVFVSPSPP